MSWACRVYRSAVQSIPSGTPTIISWDAEDYDFNNMHPPGDPTAVVIPTTGGDTQGEIWLVRAHVHFAANGVGYRRVRIKVTSAIYLAETIRSQVNAQADETLDAVALMRNMGSGLRIEVEVTQTSGGNLNVKGTSGALNLTSLEVILLSYFRPDLGILLS